jgi:hypothetical protein
MAKLTKEELEKQKIQLEKKIESIVKKLDEFNKPNPIGFNYKNRVV